MTTMFYADQPHNTTAAYVDGVRVETADDNDCAKEREMIAQHGEGRHYVERVVFGHGRVALIFRTVS